MTNYLRANVLAWTLGQNPGLIAPVSTTLGLFTISPTNLGNDGTEVTGGGYARQTVYWGAPVTDGNGNTTIANTNLIVFPTATANWGEIVAGAIFGVDGNGVSRMQYFGPIYPVETINTNNVFQLLVGDLVLSVD